MQTSRIGIRGYLLGQRPEDLETVDRGRRELLGHLDRLRVLVGDNPAQLAHADHVQALAEQWLQETTGQLMTPLGRLQTTDTAERLALTGQIRSDYLQRRTVPVEKVLAALDRMEATEQALLAHAQVDRPDVDAAVAPGQRHLCRAVRVVRTLRAAHEPSAR